MPLDIIHDRGAEPDFEAIGQYIAEPGRQRWLDLTAYIEDTYHVKPQTTYSICAGKPGWNVKYKKSGKALCTLYPEPDGFVALVVLSELDTVRFEAVRPCYSEELSSLFDKTKLFNGTKWLMIDVESDPVLEDVKRLFALKLQP
jgi:hypothetical protein